ncbi:MAG: FAD-dependent oxidoreductase [Sandaracinus sp.]
MTDSARHAPSRGTPTRVVVIGGGLAGVAATTVLAERGVEVTLLEAERFLGGRAGAWSDRLADGTSFHMERGFHAFFRQYYGLRALIRRVDPDLSLLAPMDDYPLLGPDGRKESFTNLPRRAPFNVLELVRRTPTLKMRDLPHVSGLHAAAMMAFDPERTYARWDRVTAKEYLDLLRFPAEARQMLFDVFAHSFFNPEEEYSAAELLAMFHFYFLGNPEGLVFDVMKRPFSVLFEKLEAYLREHGAEIRIGTPAERLMATPNGFRVQTPGTTLEASHVVLALSVPALKELCRVSGDALDPILRARIDALGVTLPFAVWRLFLDRKVAPERAPFAGTTGLGILDNISVFEKLEDESRGWSERTGGSIVELHAYAVDPTWDEERIKEDLLRGMHAAYPETKDARIVEDRFLVRRDCPAFRPGDQSVRPTVETTKRNLYLAGDFVKLPFASALMERAVTTGFMAANRIVVGLGAKPVDIRSVPARGLLAGAPGI